jgi:hypothetical protein
MRHISRKLICQLIESIGSNLSATTRSIFAQRISLAMPIIFRLSAFRALLLWNDRMNMAPLVFGLHKFGTTIFRVANAIEILSMLWGEFKCSLSIHIRLPKVVTGLRIPSAKEKLTEQVAKNGQPHHQLLPGKVVHCH